MADIEIQGLRMLQADHELFYGKLRSYHWNVRGPRFLELHALFERLYVQAALDVDEIAERIATLGEAPVSTYAEALELSRLKEDPAPPVAEEMLARVQSDLDHLTSSLRAGAKEAEDRGDEATFNLLEARADANEKTIWMIRASRS